MMVASGKTAPMMAAKRTIWWSQWTLYVRHHVRLIGVNTPETVDPKRPLKVSAKKVSPAFPSDRQVNDHGSEHPPGRILAANLSGTSSVPCSKNILGEVPGHLRLLFASRKRRFPRCVFAVADPDCKRQFQVTCLWSTTCVPFSSTSTIGSHQQKSESR